MENIFDEKIATRVMGRIDKLTPDTTPLWGKMSVDQMLAHCNVSYEMAYENIHPKPNAFLKLILKNFVKNAVVSEKPFRKNSQTASEFIIKEKRVFIAEKKRLKDYINKTVSIGKAHFEGKESNSFGALTAEEWNNMFYKHLDHHLTQFGV